MGKTLKNSIYYTIGAIIKAMASFLLLPIFTKMLGASEYGVLGLIQTFSTILATIMTLAVERSLYRLFYDYHTEEEKNKFLSSVFWLICISSIVVMAIIIILGRFCVQYIGNIDVYTVLVPIVIYTFLSAMVNFSQILMQVEQKGQKYLFVSILILILYNAFALFYIFFFESSVRSLVYASFTTYLIVVPIAFLRLGKRIKFKIDKKCVSAVLRYSSPMLFMIIFSWVLHYSDRLFIANMTTYLDAGVYSLAAKIVSVIIIFAGGVFQAYAPYFYNITNTMAEKEAKSILKESNSIITFIICLLSIGVIVVSKTVLELFFISEYQTSIVYIYLLTLSMVFTQQSGLLNLMIYQKKKTLGISLITIASGIISIVLNYTFIPVFGAYFAGVSNLAVGIFLITLTYLYARRCYYIDINFGILFYSVIFILLCGFCDYCCNSHLETLIIKVGIFTIWLILGIKFKLFKHTVFLKIREVLVKKLNISI